jgi:hypothetical protein
MGATASRLSALSVLCLLAWLQPSALAAADGTVQPVAALLAQPRWVGVLGIAASLLPLLMGWWLIRWFSALITAGAVAGAVLFLLHGKTAPEWAWTAAVSAAVLGGVAGWFLFTVLFAVQIAALAAALVVAGSKQVAPTLPVLWFSLGLGALVLGGWLGWRLAPVAAIVQTVAMGSAGILAGMVVLCRPQGIGEEVVLALLVLVITAPVGTWVQWRAHRRAQRL